jgi:predicted nucleic acid-binding protein
VTIVVDASVAVKSVLREICSDAADALLDHDGLIAPSIWLAEATNAFWRRARIAEITAEEASERPSELQNAPVASVAFEPHLDGALKLATEIRHPIYDCLYLALAAHHDTHAMTADRRFAAAAAAAGLTDRVRLLSP